MTVVALGAVPAAPLLLPDLSPGQPRDLREEIAALRSDAQQVWEGLPTTAETVVVVAAGREPALHDGALLRLAAYGHAGPHREVCVDHELLAGLATRSGMPRLRQDRLDGDLAILTAQLTAARPDVRVLPVTVRARSHASAQRELLAGLVEADRPLALVVAGDLAATLDETSPGYVVDGAADWDAAAVAALRVGDADAFAALGPDAAARFQARGWAPLLLLLETVRSAGLRLSTVIYRAPRGVGQVTVR